MSICKRIYALLDNTPGKSPAGMAKVLGVSTAQTTNWKTRDTDPPAKYIANICEYLGVSLRFLLTGEDDVEVFSTDEREQNLIEHFRALDYDGKNEVERVAIEQHNRVRLEGDSAKTAT